MTRVPSGRETRSVTRSLVARHIGADVVNVRGRISLVICAGVVALGVLTLACSGTRSTPANKVTVSNELWGDIKPVVSVKELMRDLIDPLADTIFESVKIVWDEHGTVETSPKTDEDWDRIRIGGGTMAEASSLLKVPRPFAPPGDENNSSGEYASELSPAQITAKLEKDPVLWNAKIQQLRNVGLEVLEIVKERNAAKLWDAGEDLDDACETCHIQYWYPGDTELYRRLDRRLEELFGPRADRIPLGMGKPTDGRKR